MMDLIGEYIFLLEDLNIYKIVNYKEEKKGELFDATFTIDRNGNFEQLSMQDFRNKLFSFVNTEKQQELINYSNYYAFPYLLEYEKKNKRGSAIEERIVVDDNFIYCIQYETKCSVVKYIGDSDVIEIPLSKDGFLISQIGYTNVEYSTQKKCVIEHGNISSPEYVKDDSFVLNKKKYKSIIIPKGIKYIIDGAFDTLEVDKILVDPKNRYYYTTNDGYCLIRVESESDRIGNFSHVDIMQLKIANNILKAQDIVVYGTENAVIPLYIYKIKKCAFTHIKKREECKNKTIYIPSDNNPHYLLVNVEDEETITVHPDCKIILANAINSKDKAKEIKLPEGLIIIQSGAIVGCTNITELDIPHSVFSIDGSKFPGCEKLHKIKFGLNLTSIIEIDKAFVYFSPLGEKMGHKNNKIVFIVKKQPGMDDNGCFSFDMDGARCEFTLDDEEYTYSYSIIGDSNDEVIKWCDNLLKSLNDKLKLINNTIYENGTKYKNINYFIYVNNGKTVPTEEDKIKEASIEKYTPDIVKEWINEPFCRLSAYLCTLDYIKIGVDLYLEDKEWEKFNKSQLENMISLSISNERVELSSKLAIIYNKKYGKNGDLGLD